MDTGRFMVTMLAIGIDISALLLCTFTPLQLNSHLRIFIIALVKNIRCFKMSIVAQLLNVAGGLGLFLMYSDDRNFEVGINIIRVCCMGGHVAGGRMKTWIKIWRASLTSPINYVCIQLPVSKLKRLS